MQFIVLECSLNIAYGKSPPDIVQLRNGRAVRGVLLEYQPGEGAVIQTTSGEVQRIHSKRIIYAGPVLGVSRDARSSQQEALKVSARAPAKVLESRSPPAQKRLAKNRTTGIIKKQALVEVTSSPLGLSLYRKTGQSSTDIFEMLCITPCRTQLPAGGYQFAISESDDPLMIKRPIWVPDGNSIARLSYQNRGKARLVGWTIFGASLITSGVLTGLSFVNTRQDCNSTLCTELPDEGLLAGAGATLIIGGLTGLVLGLWDDKADVEIQSLKRVF